MSLFQPWANRSGELTGDRDARARPGGARALGADFFLGRLAQGTGQRPPAPLPTLAQCGDLAMAKAQQLAHLHTLPNDVPLASPSQTAVQQASGVALPGCQQSVLPGAGAAQHT